MNVGLLPGFVRSDRAIDDSVVRGIPGLRQWYAADKLPVVADGTAVGLWQDSSGNGFDVTQATGSFQPLYKTNVFKGQPAVLFEGSNDRLENTAVNPFAAGEARTVFVVGKQNTTTSGFYIAFRRSAICWLYHSYISGSNFNFFSDNNGASGASISMAPLVYSMPAIATMRSAGTGLAHTLRVNCIAATVTGSTPAAETGTTGFSVGWFNAGSLSHNGYIAEVITYSGVVSDANSLLIERYLAAKYQDIGG